MSAETTVEPPATNSAPVSPVEYVRGLSGEDKQAVFLTLLREALQLNGDSGLMPIDDEDGRPFGYYVPPKTAEELYRLRGPKLTEEEEQEIDRRIKSLHPAIPITEVIADLKARLATMQHQPR